PLLALLVGMVLICLTLSTMVAERVRHFGVLRAIGATRRQVRRTVIVEAMVVGSAGTAAGLVFGILVGAAMLRVVGSSVNLHESSVVVSPVTLVFGAIAGLLTTVLAALLPARRAGGVPVVEAIQGVPPPARQVSRAAVVGTAGLALG